MIDNKKYVKEILLEILRLLHFLLLIVGSSIDDGRANEILESFTPPRFHILSQSCNYDSYSFLKPTNFTGS